MSEPGRLVKYPFSADPQTEVRMRASAQEAMVTEITVIQVVPQGVMVRTIVAVWTLDALGLLHTGIYPTRTKRV